MFNNLPIEIQVTILRNYDKSLWILSRSLNKTIRNASNIEFILNEFQYSISKIELYKFIKSKPEYFATFHVNIRANCNIYLSIIFDSPITGLYYRHYDYNHTGRLERSISKYYSDIFFVMKNKNPFNVDLLTLYKILSNRHSGELAIKAVMDIFNKTINNCDKNNIYEISKLIIWLAVHCKIFNLTISSEIKICIDYIKDSNTYINDDLKVVDELIHKIRDYLLHIYKITDKYNGINFNIPDTIINCN
jgi:hypothetical protein